MKIKTGRGTIGLTLLLAIYSISMVTSLPGLAISPILGKMETVFKRIAEEQITKKVKDMAQSNAS